MEIEQLTPLEVAARLEAEPKAVYLDVRSEREFAQAHPAGALNVPIFHLDKTTGQPLLNPQFMAVVEAVIDKKAPIYLGCASGQRSLQAASMMGAAGYEKVVNVDGGFAGKRDPFGTVLEAGWVDCGLPVDTGEGGTESYKFLLSMASGAEG